MWSHILLGRGWGSYNHESYRILDSEILQRTIEGGVLGLLVFLLVGIVVVASSRKVMAARESDAAPVALVGVLVAVAFFVAAWFFDELSFPHAAYIFLYMLGLVTLVLPRIGEAAAPPPVTAAVALAPLPEPPDPAPASQEPLVPVR